MSPLVLYIVRGVSGSGKSSLVKELIAKYHNGIGYIYSTDEFFYVDQEYRHEPKLLGIAHDWNLARAYRAMHASKSPIFIDNTNTQCWEAKRYVQFGLECGYEIQIIEPKTPWWLERNCVELARRNQHGVKLEVIQSMLARWEDNFDIDSIMNSSIPEFKVPTHQKLYLIRGVPGSGKFQLAMNINSQKFHSNGYILSPKDYFVYLDMRGYWEEAMPKARAWNLERAELLMDKGISPIFIIDSFVQLSQIKPFEEAARVCNYELSILEPRTDQWVERDIQKLSLHSSDGISEVEIAQQLRMWENIPESRMHSHRESRT
jgi:predicted kinase